MRNAISRGSRVAYHFQTNFPTSSPLYRFPAKISGPNDQKGVCVDTRASSKGVIDTRACVLTKGHLSPATAAVTILLYKLF